MKTTENNLSSLESIRIITEMISRTKATIRQGSFHLLFWGWLIVFCSLAEFFLYRFSAWEHPYYIWFLTIPGVFVSLIYGFTKGRKSRFRTYADRLYMWTWMAFLFTAITLFVLLSGKMQNVIPFILMLAGLPTFLSGIIVRFRPLITGGVIFWVMAIVSNYTGIMFEPLIMALAVISGYLIPGYLIKRKAEHEEL